MTIEKIYSDLRDCIKNDDLDGFFDCYTGRESVIYRTEDGEYIGFILLLRNNYAIDVGGRGCDGAIFDGGFTELIKLPFYMCKAVYEYGRECMETASPGDIIRMEDSPFKNYKTEAF